jgi:hypothetical protein
VSVKRPEIALDADTILDSDHPVQDDFPEFVYA